MTVIRKNVSLKSLNTFGIEASCDYYAEINSISDLTELLSNETYRSNKRLVLGGGSNLLFTGDFKGIVIKNNLKGIEVVSENGDDVFIKAAAGEIWHDLVLWALNKNLGGIENLSLIPGCVGASPMQNIGAYGAEIKNVFHELEAYSLDTGEKKIFTKEMCDFGYRESVFKNIYKDQFLITSVTYRLTRNPRLNTSYGAINSELNTMGIKDPTIRDVSNAVIRIRQSKLPDPRVTGNAGSFFKNPEVSEQKYRSLKNEFEELVAYPLENGNFKLAAGWLIEQCGLKGYERNGAAVHSKQALVLVNKHDASGEAIYELSKLVQKNVAEKFGVTLEREVNII
jgi:UDP-N-acetylmuramate dehydrogenase